MDLALLVVDVAALHRLELQVASDSAVDQQLHQLACRGGDGQPGRVHTLAREVHVHVYVCAFERYYMYMYLK